MSASRLAVRPMPRPVASTATICGAGLDDAGAALQVGVM